MCIYCGTNKYRKIYEGHYGPIPKDTTGRTYEIHHIDGNRKNNSPENLIALSIQDHFDLHYSQQDWFACHRLATRMRKPKEEIAELSRQAQLQKVASGTHPWQDKKAAKRRAKKLVKAGTHPLLRRADGTSHASDRVAAGTHHFLGGELQRKHNAKRVKDGTHPFLDKKATKARVKKQLATGKHASQIQKTCEHCHRAVDSANYSRWHGDRCKNRG